MAPSLSPWPKQRKCEGSLAGNLCAAAHEPKRDRAEDAARDEVAEPRAIR
jgi:hypothetical protein